MRKNRMPRSYTFFNGNGEVPILDIDMLDDSGFRDLTLDDLL